MSIGLHPSTMSDQTGFRRYWLKQLNPLKKVCYFVYEQYRVDWRTLPNPKGTLLFVLDDLPNRSLGWSWARVSCSRFLHVPGSKSKIMTRFLFQVWKAKSCWPRVSKGLQRLDSQYHLGSLVQVAAVNYSRRKHFRQQHSRSLSLFTSCLIQKYHVFQYCRYIVLGKVVVNVFFDKESKNWFTLAHRKPGQFFFPLCWI